MGGKRGLFVRVHARLHGEGGFTLLETVVAITVIFGALTTLAYAATTGFGYQGLARQRQAATGVANEIMETVRGLPYKDIQAGLLNTDLTGDPNIVDCSGVPRFVSCTADAEIPGSGEMIVSSPGLSNVAALVPHRSGTAPNTDPVRDGTTYEWSTYVTRDDAQPSAPYRVTVIVTWTGGAVNAPNKVVRVQSLFWSPIGCRSTSTHPFAAPCQPFYYGNATVPQSNVTVTGTVDQLSFTSGEMITPWTTASAQQEQIQQAQGTWHGAQVSVTDAIGTTVVGGTLMSTNADSDPGTTPAEYSRARCPDDGLCVSGSASSSVSGNSIAFSAPTATAESNATTSAGGANVCPAPPAAAETDALTCAGGRVLQGGALTSTLSLNHATNPGSATLVQLQTPAAASTAVVNRSAFPSTAGCSPVSTSDGCLQMTAARTLGTLNIGGLPSGMTPEGGWTGANPWNGYFLSIVGYTDSLSGSVGTESPLPTSSSSGTIYYFDPSTLTYTSVSVADAVLNGLSVSYTTTTQTIAGDELTLTVATDPAGMAAGSTSYAPTSPSGNATRTELVGAVVPPQLTIRYTLVANGQTLADLTISANLGSLEVHGTYAAAPVEGT